MPTLSCTFLFTWQVLHDFVMDRMVLLILFQYIADFIVSLRRVCPGCWRIIVVIPHNCTTLQGLWYYEPSFVAYAAVSISRTSGPLSSTALILKNCFRVLSAFWASTIFFTVRGYFFPLHCNLQSTDSIESFYLHRSPPAFRGSGTKISSTSTIFG